MGGQQKKISQRARNEIMRFTVSSHKDAGLDLMQNCDLPPPSKVFVGPDETVMLSMNRACNIAGKDEEEQQHSKHYGTFVIENGVDEDNDNKVELLKALQASQTRAREAEKKATVLRKERDGLSVALVEEAMHLFAYRQQVRLLELQVLHLKSLWLRQQQPAMSCCCAAPPEGDIGSSKEGGHGEERPSVTWVLALALTFGIGVTTALACKYLL